MSELSEERIASIQRGIADAHAGRTRPVEEVFAELGRLGRTVAVEEAADALAAIDNVLPPCPTCDGTGDLLDLICDNCGASASLPLGMTCSNHLAKPQPCPDCPDMPGRVSVADLAALWRFVHGNIHSNAQMVDLDGFYLSELRAVRAA